MGLLIQEGMGQEWRMTARTVHLWLICLVSHAIS
jgi:hypothetical protein